MIDITMPESLNRLAGKLMAENRGAAKAGLSRLLLDVQSEAVRQAPVATGNLATNITAVGPRTSPGKLTGQVRSRAPYSRFVHEGTGLFGPKKRRIRPKTKKALWWPGLSHPVSSTRGMRPNPFLARALEKTDIEASFTDGVNGFIARFNGGS